MSALVIGLIIAAFSILLGILVTGLYKLLSMAQDIAILKTQVSPLWAQIQTRIAVDLHHPHPRYIEMDGLLEKLENLTITLEERKRLEILLQERSIDMHEDISELQRKEAKLMNQVMHIVLIEAKK
jgi:hypothetical protein